MALASLEYKSKKYKTVPMGTKSIPKGTKVNLEYRKGYYISLLVKWAFFKDQPSRQETMQRTPSLSIRLLTTLPREPEPPTGSHDSQRAGGNL